MISKLISDLAQEQNNRGIGPRGPDSRIIRSPSKKTGDGDRIRQRIRDAINGHRDSEDARAHRQHNTQKEYIRTRQAKTGPRPHQLKLPQAPSAPCLLTIIATNMTDTQVDRAIDDVKCAK